MKALSKIPSFFNHHLVLSGILCQLLVSKSLNHSTTPWEVKVLRSHLGLPLIIHFSSILPPPETSLPLSPTQSEGLPWPTSLPQLLQEFSPFLVLHHRGTSHENKQTNKQKSPIIIPTSLLWKPALPFLISATLLNNQWICSSLRLKPQPRELPTMTCSLKIIACLKYMFLFEGESHKGHFWWWVVLGWFFLISTSKYNTTTPSKHHHQHHHHPKQMDPHQTNSYRQVIVKFPSIV